MKLYSIFVFAAAATLISCATPLYKEFDELKVGMDKSRVVEAVGSPSRTDYRMNKHIWTYRFFDNGQPYTKELHFEKEKLVYIGEPLPVKHATYSTTADQAEVQRDTSVKPVGATDAVVSEEIKNAVDEDNAASKKSRVVPEFKEVP